MSVVHRIDVHQHVVPPFYAKALPDRGVVQLVLNGALDRYPGARIILAHASGFVPYASFRLAELTRVFRPDAAHPPPSWVLRSHGGRR